MKKILNKQKNISFNVCKETQQQLMEKFKEMNTKVVQRERLKGIDAKSSRKINSKKKIKKDTKNSEMSALNVKCDKLKVKVDKYYKDNTKLKCENVEVKRENKRLKTELVLLESELNKVKKEYEVDNKFYKERCKELDIYNNNLRLATDRQRRAILNLKDNLDDKLNQLDYYNRIKTECNSDLLIAFNKLNEELEQYKLSNKRLVEQLERLEDEVAEYSHSKHEKLKSYKKGICRNIKPIKKYEPVEINFRIGRLYCEESTIYFMSSDGVTFDNVKIIPYSFPKNKVMCSCIVKNGLLHVLELYENCRNVEEVIISMNKKFKNNLETKPKNHSINDMVLGKVYNGLKVLVVGSFKMNKLVDKLKPYGIIISLYDSYSESSEVLKARVGQCDIVINNTTSSRHFVKNCIKETKAFKSGKVVYDEISLISSRRLLARINYLVLNCMNNSSNNM